MKCVHCGYRDVEHWDEETSRTEREMGAPAAESAGKFFTVGTAVRTDFSVGARTERVVYACPQCFKVFMDN